MGQNKNKHSSGIPNINIRSIFSRAYSTYRSDLNTLVSNFGDPSNDNTNFPKLLNSNIQLKFHYETTRLYRSFRRKSRLYVGYESNKKTREKNSQKGHPLLRDTNVTLPWIDNSLSSLFDGAFPDSLRSGISTTSRQEVDKRDNESKEAYCRPSRRCRRSVFRLLTISGISAAASLGINSQHIPKRQQPLSVKSAVYTMSKNANAGFPTFKKKNSPEALDDAHNWLSSVTRNSSFLSSYIKNISLYLDVSPDKGSQLMSLPMVLFHRFQVSLSDDDIWSTKVRQVWCVPFRIISLENMFFGQILDSVKSFNLSSTRPIYSSGMDNRRISISLVQRLRRHCGQVRGNQLYSFDYSKMDRNIPDYAFDIFFSICERYIHLSDNHYKLFQLLRFYTKYTPFVYKGSLNITSGGMSSGSLLTNLFDTWWNLTLWYFSQRVCDTPDVADLFMYDSNAISDNIESISSDIIPIRYDLAVCGDDVLCSITSFHAEIFKRVASLFEMSVTYKQPVNHDSVVYFLGRYWSNDGLPFQSFDYMYVHIIFRTKWYPKEDLPFSIDRLELYRVLSICLQFSNGLEFLETYLKDWEPYVLWKRDKSSFYLLKEWPNDGYEEINYGKALLLASW